MENLWSRQYVCDGKEVKAFTEDQLNRCCLSDSLVISFLNKEQSFSHQHV